MILRIEKKTEIVQLKINEYQEHLQLATWILQSWVSWGKRAKFMGQFCFNDNLEDTVAVLYIF